MTRLSPIAALILGFLFLPSISESNAESKAITSPPSASPPKSTDLIGQLVSAPSSDGKFKVKGRPLVTTVHPGDPFQFAIHFGGKDKPLDPFAQDSKADLLKTLESILVSLKTPGGQTYQLNGAATDGRQKWLKGFQSLGQQATHAIQLNHQGIRTVGSWGGIVIEWASDKPFPKFDQPGTYAISIKGKIVLQGSATDFDLPTMQFKVDKSVQPVKKAFEAAMAAQRKHVADATLMKHKQTESGFLRDMIHEDKQGNRLMDLNVTKGGFKWGFDLVRVTLNPKGEVLRVQQREVFTCVAQGVNIETPTGPQKIETLKRGDKVIAFDTKTKRRVVTTVQTIRRSIATETLTFPGGLRVTPNHPIFANGLWTPAGKLSANDQLLSFSPDETRAQSVALGKLTRQIQTVNVFDLTVGGPHNYFAGGILVHNKDRAWSPNLDDPWHFTWPAKPHKWETAFDAKK